MTYEKSFKEEAVRLSEEIGVKNAAEQLGKHRAMMKPQSEDIINMKIAEKDPSFLLSRVN